jgi:hypothetical protein
VDSAKWRCPGSALDNGPAAAFAGDGRTVVVMRKGETPIVESNQGK